MSYFTAGEKEVRAWTIHRGDKAPQAAAVIHTDFERGFIRAETVTYDDFVRLAGWKGAREKGVVRSEGKEYVVREQDGQLALRSPQMVAAVLESVNPTLLDLLTDGAIGLFDQLEE